MADSSSLHNGTIPLVAEIGGVTAENPSIRLKPKLLGCWKGRADLAGMWASPPNKCLVFPESKCAKKFQVKYIFKSSTGCRHLEVVLGLLSEMSCFLTRCQHFRRCKVCFFLFFCGKVNNRLGKTLWTKMISLHISGVNAYWFWQTAVKQYGVVVFGGDSPNEPMLCNTCGLERYLTMILASWHNKVLTDSTREWFCYPTPKLVTAVGSSGYLHPRKLRWIPRLWSGKGDSF